MLMPRLASWLNIRPRNLMIAIVVAIILPAPVGPAFTGCLIVFAVLSRGLRDGVFFAVAAIACYGVMNQLASGALNDTDTLARMMLTQQMGLFVLTVGIGVVFGEAIRRTGSITLVVQMSILVSLLAAGLMIGAKLPLYESAKPLIEELQVQLAASGQETASLEPFAAYMDPVVALIMVFSVWTSVLLAGFIGYTLYGGLAGVDYRFGRFRDVSFGRLIAGALAIFCILATLTQSPMVAALAMFLLLTFVINGLAFTHWVVANRALMPGLLVLVYLSFMLPPFNGVSVIGFAVLGYFDAWFDLRKHIPVVSA